MPSIAPDKLTAILDRHKSLGNKLANPAACGNEFAAISREYSELGSVVETIMSLQMAQQELADATAVLNDPKSDAEMKAMFKDEKYELEKLIPELENQVQLALLPKDKDDGRNVIIEVRAGTGGDEAGLFAGELYRMYQRYAEVRGYTFETISYSETGVGGIKEASATINGKGAFGRLKFESGVHRVQRVPVTETSGRIHTSAATVAVLPEAEEVDIQIEEKDLRIDVFRSSGPGGQSVNTTDSAVRIVHIPTGITVQQQDEKSQHKNRAKALRVLRSRIYEAERAKVDSERSQARKLQVGSGDRSERIRTYNFPQGRVSDHRINLTLYKLDLFLLGNALDEMIDALIAADEAERLAELAEQG
jgi:peptide chain release factor 1